MNTQTIIQKLGYPKKQAQIYLASLKMGEATVSEIAERVEMPRTSIAELISEMHKKGLMHFYLKRNRKYWVAQNPDKLMENLKEQEKLLASALPWLHSKENKKSPQPTTNFYVGMAEIKNIFNDIIHSKHHLKALISWDDFLTYMGKGFVFDFIDRHTKNFLKIKLLVPKSPATEILREKYSTPLRQARFLPSSVVMRRFCHFLYADKTALISFGTKEPIGTIIHDIDTSQALALYFDNLWQLSNTK